MLKSRMDGLLAGARAERIAKRTDGGTRDGHAALECADGSAVEVHPVVLGDGTILPDCRIVHRAADGSLRVFVAPSDDQLGPALRAWIAGDVGEDGYPRRPEAP